MKNKIKGLFKTTAVADDLKAKVIENTFKQIYQKHMLFVIVK